MHMLVQPPLTIFVVISVVFSKAASAPCSPIDRGQNMSLCLSGIRELIIDFNAFWFGSMYPSLCPAGQVDLECTPRIESYDDSIISRMFDLATFDPSKIDRFLTLQYTSPAGRYTGCGSTFYGNTINFDIDPLSDDVHHPWYIRNVPEMTWQTSPGELYTVLMYDVGYHINHVVYVNIEGNDVTTAEVMKPYNGPLHPLSFVNPYAFMVFRQQSRITVGEDWRENLNNRSSGYKPGDFASAFPLYGPIAVNVLRVVMDAYSIQRFIDMHVLNNCPQLVAHTADRQNRSLIADAGQLSVSMTIEYHSPSIIFISCCRTYNKMAGHYRLNPLFDSSMASWVVRTSVLPNISFLKREMFPAASDFMGTSYTLVLLDLEQESGSGPFVHWMVVDITDGVIENGQTVFTYRGPEPIGGTDHQYYFLLYRQTEAMDTSTLTAYTGSNCPDKFINRCEFQLPEFVFDNALTLVGASWMSVGNDEYSRFLEINGDSTEASSICSEVQGYSDPCPDCSSDKLRDDSDQCLSAIGQTMNDIDAFWFGADYRLRCWNGDIEDVDCWNPSADTVDDLATRLFPDGSFNSSLLHTPLEVTYTTEPGYYPGCGYNEWQGASETFHVNPLSRDNIYQSWKTSQPPTYHWQNQTGELYCLIVYDAGRRHIVSLYVNAESAELFHESKVIKEYSTLTNAMPLENPYVFLLFLQNRTIDQTEQSQLESLALDMDLSETRTMLGLTGPVGLNWILIEMDLYGVGEAFENKVFNNCPLFINEATEKQDRPFLPKDVTYKIWLDIVFESPPYKYTACCKTFNLQSTTAELNPLGNGSFPTSSLRTGLHPKVTWFERGTFHEDKKPDTLYTLLNVDPDVPISTFGTIDKPLLHWLVLNLNRLTDEQEEVHEYWGPAPPDDKPHSYYFLLYEQKGDIDSSKVGDYVGNCTGRLAGRCLFDIASFVSDYQLELVGATWMVSSHDYFVKYQHLQRGMDEAGVCEGVENYRPNCVSSAPIITSGFSLVYFLSVLLFVHKFDV